MHSAAVLLLLATGLALGGASASDFDPHLPDMLSRSWFQGWYLRLSADGGGLGDVPASLALILGYVPRGREGWNISLASLVVQRGASSHSQPDVYETNGAQLAVTAGGRLVLRQPDPAAPANLTVSSADGRFRLHVHEGGCSAWADFEGGSRLSMSCLGPPARPWGPGGEGPEGKFSRLPDHILGLHWFVLSLGTPVKFTWTEKGRHPVIGTGQLHMETNWGEAFPPCWVWSQGNSPDAAFAFAGGNVPALPRLISPKVWLLGVHTKRNSWNLRPWDPTYFSVDRDPCAGTLTLHAQQAWREVEIEVAAPPGSFAALQCPTEEGFRPFSAESFSGRAEVRRYTRGWDLSRQLLDSFIMENVGLEFGGDCRCPDSELGGRQEA